MKGAVPYLVILLWLVIVETFAEYDAHLSIRCFQAGGVFRKEKPDDFFRGRDLCYEKVKP